MAATKFDTATRTSIQKRLEKQSKALKAAVKAAVGSEFKTTLKKGNDENERRFVRALMVVVANTCLDSELGVHNVLSGMGASSYAFHYDLKVSGKFPKAAPEKKKSHLTVVGPVEAENEDEDEAENEDEEQEGVDTDD
jgi:hypothetical protein